MLAYATAVLGTNITSWGTKTIKLISIYDILSLLKGGQSHGLYTVRRHPAPPHGDAGFDQSHRGGISAGGPALPYGRMAPGGKAAHPTGRYTPDQNYPMPAPEDRFLFILVSLQTYPLHRVWGRRFGMGHSKTEQ